MMNVCLHDTILLKIQTFDFFFFLRVHFFNFMVTILHYNQTITTACYKSTALLVFDCVFVEPPS